MHRRRLFEKAHLILVEDDDVDARAVERAFKKAGLDNPIIRVVDGHDALALLRGDGDREPPPGPRILLADINMPRMNGLQLVTRLREDPALRSEVVFVLTTSDRDEDMVAAYGLNVAGYILKQSVGADYARLTQLFDRYWGVVALPDQGGGAT